MRRRKAPKKNIILKAITAVMAVMACLGVMMLDSENLTIPLVMIAISFVWIALFALANKEELEDD